MYCQLGIIVFDSLNSFITFTQDEEAVLVEHALISRKPRIQGAGQSLQTLTVSMFFHQEFCDVEGQVSDLRKSKDSFEILPLLWGNGRVEGDFVIKQMTVDKVQQDSQGNTYAATVNVILKEWVKENTIDQAQQDAQKNGFATGKKQPAAKSSRVNPVTCQKQISDRVSSIRSGGDRVNAALQGFHYEPVSQMAIQVACEDIIIHCAKIIVATQTPDGCVYDNDRLRVSANNVRASADAIKGDVYNRAVNVSVLKSENTILQSAISTLVNTASSVIQKAIIP